ncbi:MAG: ABC transporter permease [Bryobacterales bacterium]|nr:ABC transporter permease [Bryobacterales bacterium]
MRLVRVLRQRLRSILRGSRVDDDLVRELAFHLDELTRENLDAGMPPDEARSAARRALGGLAQLEEQCRDHRRVSWLRDWARDFLYAWRSLAKTPRFTAVAVATLSLGVGASIAVYALAEALLLHSLPYPDPEQLVYLGDMRTQNPGGFVSQAKFRDWRESSTVFERMALTTMAEATLTGNGDAERIEGRAVSEGFFEMLGVQPQLGRWFSAEEQRPGGPCVVMLSRDLWTRRLQGRYDAVGSSVVLDGRPCFVTGVMPASFHFNESGFKVAEYWTPIDRVIPDRRAAMYWAYARLLPGVSIEAAQAQMSQIASRLAQSYKEDEGSSVGVLRMRDKLLEPLRDELSIFAVAALLVLFAACANVAGLLLARGFGRSKELAVRVTLGAGRARVMRLLFAESLLLSGFSALLGALLAVWLLRAAIAAADPRMELGEAVRLSPWLVLFAMALTLITGLLAGLWPALSGSRTRIERDLRESGAAMVSGNRQMRSLHLVVVAEVALAVVLLTFAGLLSRSFVHLMQTDLGYRTERLLTFQIPLPAAHYRTAAQRKQFWDTLLPQLQAIPGARSVAASDSLPLSGRFMSAPFEVEGQNRPANPMEASARGLVVTSGYFQTLGIELRRGRLFDDHDAASNETALVVNEAFARKLLPGREPIGARVRFAGASRWAHIVGVVADVRFWGPVVESDAEAYVLDTAAPQLQFVAIHTTIPEQSILAEARKAVQRIDPALPLTQVRTMRQAVDEGIATRRQMMALLVGFGVVTLLMAALGLSGVLLYAVSRRRREIGLRIALGARPADVSLGVLRTAAKLLAVGSVLGVAAALAGGRVLESALSGVSWYDPATLAAAPAVLAAITLAVCLAPARRASAVQPMETLRQQ